MNKVLPFPSKVKSQSAIPAASGLPIKDDSIDAETLLGMDFPPLEYIIPGYVVEGLSVLAGKPKLGKSWLAYGKRCSRHTLTVAAYPRLAT